MAAAEPGAAVASDGVDLVDEDDAGGVLLALLEQVADPRSADADEHLDEVGTRDREERHARFTGHGLGEQRLAGPRRAHEKNALGDLAAEAGELLGVLEELDDLLELLLGLVDAGDVGEGHLLLVGRQQPCLGLAERHGLGAAGLHLTEEDEPQADQDEQWQPSRHRFAEHPAVGRFLDLDFDILLSKILDQIVVAGVVGMKVVSRRRCGLLGGAS